MQRIQILVGRGVFLDQLNGVLYGAKGEVVGFDPERVTAEDVEQAKRDGYPGRDLQRRSRPVR